MTKLFPWKWIDSIHKLALHNQQKHKRESYPSIHIILGYFWHILAVIHPTKTIKQPKYGHFKSNISLFRINMVKQYPTKLLPHSSSTNRLCKYICSIHRVLMVFVFHTSLVTSSHTIWQMARSEQAWIYWRQLHFDFFNF